MERSGKEFFFKKSSSNHRRDEHGDKLLITAKFFLVSLLRMIDGDLSD